MEHNKIILTKLGDIKAEIPSKSEQEYMRKRTREDEGFSSYH